ncbi:MAG: DUF167 domain-containing protein [Synechococcales bacterium]|nr:DUF167 domain-containing protein [Synechococcales bacterium]
MTKIQVKAKPNSKVQDIQTAADGSLVVRLKSPPTDGKANAELIGLLAEHLQVPRSSIRIKTGLNSRQKLIEVDD